MTQDTVQPAATGTSFREDRAERYYSIDLKNQQVWYASKARRYKLQAQLHALFVIAAGAGTASLQVFGNWPWTPAVTAALGFALAVVEGWRGIARYGETWVAYRKAAEKLKRERRLYVYGAGSYHALGDEEAFTRFIDAVEEILSEEQQIYWRDREEDGWISEKAGAQPTGLTQ